MKSAPAEERDTFFALFSRAMFLRNAKIYLRLTSIVRHPINRKRRKAYRRNVTIPSEKTHRSRLLLTRTVAPLTFRSIFDKSANVFRDKFRNLTDDEWEATLSRSISEGTIEGVEFPKFPEESLQLRIHGHWGAESIQEAMSFYKFTKSRNYILCNLPSDASFLDFGSGWGRITRTYLRDFDLKRIFGFDPNLTYCATARMLNPYICFMNGDYLPDGTLPDKRFNLVVGWSVFSHLPPCSATEWLKEMARITRPGGHIVMTTWGLRFLNRLFNDQKAMKNGAEIHWYSKICIEGGGDIGKCIDAYSKGEFVWFTESGSDLYGQAFLGENALKRLLAEHRIPLDLVEFDTTSLGQDVFVLTRR